MKVSFDGASRALADDGSAACSAAPLGVHR
jgi:hypothetical protein